jgi:hypothetical protein
MGLEILGIVAVGLETAGVGDETTFSTVLDLIVDLTGLVDFFIVFAIVRV